jgi:hypothetical protein
MLTQARISTVVTACKDVEDGMDVLKTLDDRKWHSTASNWRLNSSLRGALLSGIFCSKAVWFCRYVWSTRGEAIPFDGLAEPRCANMVNVLFCFLFITQKWQSGISIDVTFESNRLVFYFGTSKLFEWRIRFRTNKDIFSSLLFIL